MAYRGALVFKAYPTDQSVPTNTWTMATWADDSTNGYDTDGFFNSSNPTRLTVPAGVTKIRIMAQTIWAMGNGAGFRQVVIKKNGAFFYGDPIVNVLANSATTTDIGCISPVLNVTPGDYFEVELFHTDGGNLALLASTGTFFSIEVICECDGTTEPEEPETSDIASGGTITTLGDYKIHKLTASENFVVTAQPVSGDFDYLLIGAGAGGGYGGGGAGGGGGAAGRVRTGNTALANGTYPVVIGLGGAKPASNSVRGGTGGDSTFNGITAEGGSGGGSSNSSVWAGGSGVLGGGGCYSGAGGTGSLFSGGAGGTGGAVRGGGGAGSNGAGVAGSSTGAGGAGTTSSITGTSQTYGVGGTGGTAGTGTPAAGAANTGNGGGGGFSGGVAQGEKGADGVLYVKYKFQ